MTNYTFKETINYLSEKLGSKPPQEDVAAGEVELFLDGAMLILKQGLHEGSFEILMNLGFFQQPPSTTYLTELGAANFLGINTGGCTLCLDEEEITLSLKAVNTAGSTPQQNWEMLQRVVAVAHAWSEILKNRKDFSLVVDLSDLKAVQEVKTDNAIKA